MYISAAASFDYRSFSGGAQVVEFWCRSFCVCFLFFCFFSCSLFPLQISFKNKNTANNDSDDDDDDDDDVR